MARTHYRTCNLCEAMCGVAITVEGDQITDVRGDEDDPFSRGHICPKAVGLKDVHEDPDRLRLPMRRNGSSWETIGWDRAFDEVAARIKAVQAKHGRHAVAVYQGNPTVHNHGSMIYGQMFVRSLRTHSMFSATSLDQLPQMLAALTMFGHQLLLPVPDIDRTHYLLIFGANPLASNGSLMTAPGVEARLKAIRARGGKIVLVDPRRTETARIADRHIFIRPGTDALLMLALIHVIAAENGFALGRLAGLTDGIEAVKAVAAPFSPEEVEGATGVAADQIRLLARELMEEKPAAVYGRVGISTQEFGGLSSWLVNVLNIVTGNLDRPGGAMFTRPAIDVVAAAAKMGQAGHFGRRKSRVRGLPEFGGELPAAVLAEEIDTPGEGQIHALVTSAGNPVLSSPNGRRLEQALASLELMVSIDIYLNETTRHAHYILPPTFALEHDHYDLAFHLLAVRNTAKYSEALFPRKPDARHDWEIFLELASRLEGRTLGKRLAAPLKRGLLLALGPNAVLDLGLRLGPYGRGYRPFKEGLSLGRLKEEPHGVDLGPLEPCLPERLFTDKKRIALAPEIYLKDIGRLEAELSRIKADGAGLTLIGRRELRSNNSWMHNSERLVKGKDRCTILMSSADAQANALTDGESVEVTSRVGSLVAKLEISDTMMPGVVCLPHGWGHHRDGIRLRIAQKRPGVSINDLTDEAQVDTLCGNISFSGVPVTIQGKGKES